ncbi:MAG: aldo/keto reductase [Deltaproteobacteria bacterium]|nr:aldo/keto reductase [Deltaproteobacteria bacterium]MBW2419623.1 aldo/keto reductase [Deltaproteobacteria bacterium]
MDYVPLGRTGVKVSRICLGCMSYGSSSWRPWVLDEEDSMPFFRRAVEAGINFFDTADMYSLGLSEEVTGKALQRYANRDEVVIATKVFFPVAKGPNMGGLSRKHIQQACEDSLRRLGVDCIDLYQIHRLDPETPIEEMVSALDWLVQQGKVRYLGASSMYAWQFAQCLATADRIGAARFVAMQNHYNLVYREEEREMLPLCEAEGVGVIPWSPLARGLLAGSRRSLQDLESTTRSGSDGFAQYLYKEPSDWEVAEAVAALAGERGVEPAQIALAWLLSRPGVTAPIVGATKLAHLEAALAAVEVELSEEEIEKLEAPYRPHRVLGH